MVDRFAHDPRLNSETIAEGIGVSRRTLYDLTETDQGGISERIRVARARRALAMLQEPDAAPVPEIAELCGFSSEKQLRRTLHAVYGVTPASVRSAALRNVRGAS